MSRLFKYILTRNHLSIIGSIYRVGDNDKSADATPSPPRNISGLFELTVERQLPKTELESPTTINCILSLPGTDYTKKRETIFYGKYMSIYLCLLLQHTHTHQRCIHIGRLKHFCPAISLQFPSPTTNTIWSS